MYVTVQPHPSVESIVTPLVHNDGKPVWDYQFVTKIPNYYLDSAVRGCIGYITEKGHRGLELYKNDIATCKKGLLIRE